MAETFLESREIFPEEHYAAHLQEAFDGRTWLPPGYIITGILPVTVSDLNYSDDLLTAAHVAEDRT
jgi:hypothetical protein